MNRIAKMNKKIKNIVEQTSIALQLTVIAAAALLIVIALLVYQNQYAVQLMHDNTIDVIASDLDGQVRKIDEHLQKIDDYIFNLGVMNERIQSLCAIKKKSSYNMAKRRIVDDIVGDLDLYMPVGEFFLYVPSGDDMFSVSTKKDSYEWRLKAEEILCGVIKENPEKWLSGNDMWEVCTEGGINFLYNIHYVYGIYIGAFVNVDLLMDSFKNSPKYDSEMQILLDTSGDTLYKRGDVLENVNYSEILEMNEEGNVSYLDKNKRHIYVGTSPEKLPVSLYTIVDDKEVLDQFYYIHKFLPVLGIALLLLVPLFMFMILGLVVRPVKKMIDTMNKIKSGELSGRMEVNETSEEFSLLNRNFNDMMDEIESLKIEAYERKLEYSRMELSMLKLQLNPHFFSNTLNVIYRLAQMAGEKKLEDISMSLIRFFRYAISGNSALVSLLAEVEHVEDYLKIQGYRYGNFIDVQMNIARECKKNEIGVPRMCIQELIENCIKYAYVSGDTLKVSVDIYLEDENNMVICVEDNGPGFKQEIMDVLNSDFRSLEADGHIGLTNLFRRMDIIYGNTAKARCFNRKDGGAVVELKFPAGYGGTL